MTLRLEDPAGKAFSSLISLAIREDDKAESAQIAKGHDGARARGALQEPWLRQDAV
jgi:hypothetical protein